MSAFGRALAEAIHRDRNKRLNAANEAMLAVHRGEKSIVVMMAAGDFDVWGPARHDAAWCERTGQMCFAVNGAKSWTNSGDRMTEDVLRAILMTYPFKLTEPVTGNPATLGSSPESPDSLSNKTTSG